MEGILFAPGAPPGGGGGGGGPGPPKPGIGGGGGGGGGGILLLYGLEGLSVHLSYRSSTLVFKFIGNLFVRFV